jgi:hypothetical protein
MAKRTITLPSFGGVAASSTATLNAPIGYNYHSLILSRGGTFTHDHMEGIRVLCDGVPVWDITGAHLDDHQLHDGIAVGGADLSIINFERAGLSLPRSREATSINSRLMRTLQIEVDIASGASSPTLSAKGVVSTGQLADNRIIKKRKYTRSAAGAGTLEISDLAFGSDLINRVFFHSPTGSGKISAVTMKRDNAIVFERTLAENQLLQSNGVKTNVANTFVVDPTELGAGDQAYVTAGVSDLKFELTMSAAETVTVYVEYLGLHNAGH